MPKIILVHALSRHLIPQRNKPFCAKLPENGIKGNQSKNTWKSKVLLTKRLEIPIKPERQRRKKREMMQRHCWMLGWVLSNPILTQTSLQSPQEQSKTLTCSLSSTGSLTLIFPKRAPKKKRQRSLMLSLKLSIA